jgi:hypothetical protein
MSRAAAAYDALTIVEGLMPDFGSLLEVEVHTVSYLAFLLGLSDNQQPEFWGYPFAATDAASPISADLDDAILSLLGAGLLLKEASKLSASSSAASVLKSWTSLPGNVRRRPYLDAAIGAARSLSLPIAIRAVHREPQLSRAGALGVHNRALPDDLGLPELLADLREVDSVLLEQGLSSTADRHQALLLSRAHLWLSYLASEPEAGELTVEVGPSPV